MERPWPERRAALLQERDAQVQAAATPQELAERCVAILVASGSTAHCSWSASDPLLTISYTTSSGEKGLFYGYGQARIDAALQCFQNIWLDFVILTNAPSPTQAERAMRQNGRALRAIRDFMERTGVTLLEARVILKV